MKIYFVFSLFSIFLLNCYSGGFFYKENPKILQSEKTNSLTITQVIDSRPNIPNERKSWIALIPLVIYGTNDINKIEDSKRYNLGTPILNIFNAGIETELSKKFLLIKNGKRKNLSLEASLNGLTCKEKYFTYGLSFFGSILYILGAPALRLECKIEVSFTLKEGNKISDQISITHSDSKYSILYTDANLNKIKSLPIELISDIMFQYTEHLRTKGF
ncbi:hypothetical protein [Leptospira dzoumogneensis]|uniref:Uncharacterized protein n=1 Tax=Leptospira dzoumogneensis TaxID=2484904 RepID=A0A4Z1AGL7_9LEPT|nr:hypothetical protein [Leptospira dzoumogneensis]TGM97316.1 hypothetical protein EHR06_14295 [Leptospira dzoumogneensis]